MSPFSLLLFMCFIRVGL